MVFILRGSVGLQPFNRPNLGISAVKSSFARPVGRRCRAVHTRAMGESFDLNLYYEASIGEIRSVENRGHILYLRLKDGRNSLLPVFIGDFECGSLVQEMTKQASSRPGTHDLMKNMLQALGYRVSKIRITALVGRTYHARVHFARGRSIKPSTSESSLSSTEVDIDARPSDAINMALRFGAPIYVNREVAAEESIPSSSIHNNRSTTSSGAATSTNGTASHQDITASEIVRSCQDEILHYSDPTIMHKLQLQLAIAEERFEDATKLRDIIDKLLASDRAMALVVAIETALEDKRYEEAARLRDEFRRLRMTAHVSKISDIIDI